jgi:putative redox protein
MKATAHRSSRTGFTHTVNIRQHQLVADEPVEDGGDDEGPSALELLAGSLAACTAITMEMYSERKGWDIGEVEVEVEFTPAERGCPTRFNLALRLPADCTDEQRERLQLIAAKCPVHRALEGDVVFEDRLELIQPAAH